MTKILWLVDDSELSKNGLLVHQEEKLWFVRKGKDDFSPDTIYQLYRLPDSLLLDIEKDQEKYFQLTGAPRLHGETRIMRKNAIHFVHSYNPSEITGELIIELLPSQIENLFVPHPLSI